MMFLVFRPIPCGYKRDNRDSVIQELPYFSTTKQDNGGTHPSSTIGKRIIRVGFVYCFHSQKTVLGYGHVLRGDLDSIGHSVFSCFPYWLGFAVFVSFGAIVVACRLARQMAETALLEQRMD